VSNNRVIILGAPGGVVVNLANDNMNLLEVLALVGGPDGGAAGGSTGIARNGGRVDNVRIIRGDLKNPQVQFVNLSTLEGMRRGNLQVEPNDIIYIQPVRRAFLDALVDAGPALALSTTLISLISFTITILR
jgi:polysaccharide export outer membrane protein